MAAWTHPKHKGNQHTRSHLKNIKIHTGCFGKTLDVDYDKLINAFKMKFECLQTYTSEVLEDGIEINTTWKIHILACHVSQWLGEHPVGLGYYAAQTCESTHSDYKKTEKRFLVSEANPDHPKKLLRSVVDYSSRRLWIGMLFLLYLVHLWSSVGICVKKILLQNGYWHI